MIISRTICKQIHIRMFTKRFLEHTKCYKSESDMSRNWRNWSYVAIADCSKRSKSAAATTKTGLNAHCTLLKRRKMHIFPELCCILKILNGTCYTISMQGLSYHYKHATKIVIHLRLKGLKLVKHSPCQKYVEYFQTKYLRHNINCQTAFSSTIFFCNSFPMSTLPVRFY